MNRAIATLTVGCLGAGVSLSSIAPLHAQIVPDTTLGTENSVLGTGVVNGASVPLIEGGAQRQHNLFHSFTDFSLATGEVVYFANPAGVENILSRVTGANISNLDGLLGVAGSANLFLLNPNGIVFGPNARLDINGSFLASTAASIPFADGSEFHATPAAASLLTISVPLGIQFNTQPQGDLTNAADLAIAPGQTLTLWGDTVRHTGGLTAPGGTVQILGNRVALLDQARVDVSGNVASSGDGGTVYIGGDVAEPIPLPRAQRTLVGADATIAATGVRNGGEVIIWSDEVTAFYGTIAATGGDRGGFVDISGQRDLHFQGAVDVTSPSGTAGTLRFDPANILIVDGATGANDGEVLTDQQILFGDGAIDDTLVIAEATLENLAGAANLILEATNDITVADLTDDALTFARGSGSITWLADRDRDGQGAVIMQDPADTLFTNGRDLQLAGASLSLGNIDTGFRVDLTGLPVTTIGIDAGGELTPGSTFGTSEFTFTVPAGTDPAIANVDVQFAATHTWVSDLAVTLTSPAATTVELFSGVGGNGDDFQDTRLSDQAATSIANAVPPFVGTFRPEAELAAFQRENPTGTWILTVTDNFQGDTGELLAAGDAAPWGTALGTQLALTTADPASLDTILPPDTASGGAVLLQAQAGDLTMGNLTLPEPGMGAEILANGNISLGDYAGAAVRIEASGDVQTGNLIVTSPAANAIATGAGADADLRANRRAAIVRAGGDAIAGLAAVNPGATGLPPGQIDVGNISTFSDVGENGGPIVLEARGAIAVNGSLDTTSRSDVADVGNAGDVTVTAAQGGITINGDVVAYTLSFGGNSGDGGDVAIAAGQGDVTLGFVDAFAFSEVGNSGRGGNITVTTESGNITADGFISATVVNSNDAGDAGDAGDIVVTAAGDITIDTVRSDSQTYGPGAAGNGGDITILTAAGDITATTVWSYSRSFTEGAAQAGGDVQFVAAGDIFINDDVITYGVSEEGPAGAGGDITLIARDGAIRGENTFRGGNAIVTALSLSLEEAETGAGGDVALVANEIAGIEILTLSTTAQSGNVAIQGGDRLAIDNLRITTTGQVEVPDPIAPRGVVVLDLSDFGQAGNTQITSAGDITFNDVEIQSSANGSQPAGGVTITSPGQVTFNNSQILSNANQDGAAGQIAINSDRLVLGNGGRLFAATAGAGNGGAIAINATSAVQLGAGVQDFEPVISVEASGAGRPGNIIINTPQFELAETARITATSTATATNSASGGSIALNANQMNLAGIVGIFAETQGVSPGGVLILQPYAANPDFQVNLAPGAAISATTTGSGNGGDLRLRAPGTIQVQGAGRLTAETRGTGQGGNILAEAQRLTLADGVVLSAATAGSGNAGNVVFNLRDRLDIDNSSVASNTELGSIGDGGNITVTAAQTTLQNGGQMTVSTAGQGIGGNVVLTGDRLVLRDRSRISANTRSSDGGNLTFNLTELLLLRNGSLISTEAGTARAGGNGGDIRLNVPNGFIVAVPRENSDIRANAFAGNGGNVNVTALSLIGIEFRPNVLDTPFSDITASSQFGSSGTVIINELAPELSPAEAALESEVAPPPLVPGCRAPGSQTGRFVVTGRGGLPTQPIAPLSAATIWPDLDPIAAVDETTVPRAAAAPGSDTAPPPAPVEAIVTPLPIEAQHMIRGADGRLRLVATTPTAPDTLRPVITCTGAAEPG